MSTIYTDIKLEKLEDLLEWLKEEPSSEEVTRLIKRVEQQIIFLKLPEEEGKKYFDSLDTR